MNEPLSLVVPASLWLKSSASGGKKRRIGGPVSTEARDLQRELVYQVGLDFQPLLADGVFKDEHTQETHNVLGEPESVEPFRKGQRLPDDTIAEYPLSWIEGFLLEDYEPADKIWNLVQAMAKGSKRRLGFSVEGSVLARDPMQPLNVIKGVVRDVAITRKPMNMTTRLEVLAKSLSAGTTGAALISESLEGVLSTVEEPESLLRARARAKRTQALTKSEAAQYILAKFPQATPQQVARIYVLASKGQLTP